MTSRGQIAIARVAPGQRELADRFLANFTEALSSPNLSLRLGNEPSVDEIVALAPDLVVVATGAKPYRPPLPASPVRVVSAWDVLAGAEVGSRVVIADWGGDPSGVDTAEILGDSDRDVSLIVGSHAAAESLHPYRRALAMHRLYGAGVKIVHHYRLRTIGGSDVEFENIYRHRSRAASRGRYPRSGARQGARQPPVP